MPQAAFKNIVMFVPKYLKCYTEWSDLYHKIEFANDSLRWNNFWKHWTCSQYEAGITLGSRKTLKLWNHYSVFLCLQLGTFFSAGNVLTIPAFSFAFPVCIDIFLALCSLCILFSICHAIKPTLDSAIKCSHALIPEKKEPEYKRHFMMVLTVAICDSLCLMVPLLNSKSIHFFSWLHQQVWGIWAEVKMNVKRKMYMLCYLKSDQCLNTKPKLRLPIWDISYTMDLPRAVPYLSEKVPVSLQMHLNWFPNTCLTQFIWRVEKSERGAFKCRRWQHARPRMYRLCGFSCSLSHHGSLPLFLLALVSSSHSLFCSLFSLLSLCFSLSPLCLFLWLLH